MTLRDDTRGQAIQIGAVLLFGTLIIAFSSYQAFVVPDQNREVEFKHNQEVQGDMQDLRNAVVSMTGNQNGRSASVTLGTRYPSRLIALNPGPPAGTLRTVGTTNRSVAFNLTNAVATDGDTDDFWNGDRRSYNTGSIVYDPNYNLYDSAPTTVYGQTVLYNRFDDGAAAKTSQLLIDGTDLSVVTVNGSLSRTAADATAVDVRPISTGGGAIDVEDGSNPIELNFQSGLPATQWEQLLESEYDPDGSAPDKYVSGISGTPLSDRFYEITLTLEPAEYDLTMTKVGVGVGATEESDAYLTAVTADPSATTGSTTDVVLEVRDQYNNPVEGVTVEGGVAPGNDGTVDPQAESDDDGRVQFEYAAPDSTGSNQLNFSIDELNGTFDDGTPEDVSLNVEVTAGGTSGPNGPEESGLIYNDDATQDPTTTGGVGFTVTNEVGEEIEITDVTIDPVDDEISLLDDTVANPISPPSATESELYISADSDGYVDTAAEAELPVSFDLDDGSYYWSNGNPVLSAGSDATFDLYEFRNSAGDQFDMDGRSVTLTVTYRPTAGGQAETSTFTIRPGGTGGNQVPTAEFQISTASGNNQYNIDGSGSSDPDGSIATYEWDLDDDGIFDDETGQTPGKTKIDADRVSLRVTDDSGDADTATKAVP
ncbi:PKD domain-containing protein [Halorientalis regularis]|uniref:PKD domain-containing protein n=1 Tax=Halorientalis regularis TaxID=660518 RepID=UPI000B80FF55|nr:PKD domain-containing protein [Halorientalis regularis]